jgi:hypothetical protein
MNDNLHKKFRRQNHLDHQYSSLHPTDGNFSHINNNNQIYHSGQLNGDHKTNINQSTIKNGQALSTGDADEDDDDDDIVLVSDDDSEDKKTEIKINSMNYSNKNSSSYSCHYFYFRCISFGTNYICT